MSRPATGRGYGAYGGLGRRARTAIRHGHAGCVSGVEAMPDRSAFGRSAIFAARVTDTAPDFTASATSGTPVFWTLAARFTDRVDTCNALAASGCVTVVELLQWGRSCSDRMIAWRVSR
jgi:hypothetical protein